MASELTRSELAADQAAVRACNITAERAGGDQYKQTHMTLIFQQGLSFSGFERNKTFIGGPGMRFVDLSESRSQEDALDQKTLLRQQ